MELVTTWRRLAEFVDSNADKIAPREDGVRVRIGTKPLGVNLDDLPVMADTWPHDKVGVNIKRYGADTRFMTVEIHEA